MVYPEHEITEADKEKAIRIRGLLKEDNEYFLTPRDHASRLRPMGQVALADFLEDFCDKYGLKMADIIAEVMIDEELGEDLEQLTKDLNGG